MKFKKNGKFFKSLRFRILIILIILGIVPSVIVTEMVIANYEDRAIANRVQSMENICDIMCDLLIKENYLNDTSSQTVNSKLELLSNSYGGRILIVDRDFRIIKDTYGVDEGRTLVSQKVLNCFKGEDAYQYDSDSQKLILAVPVKSPDVKQVQGAMMIMASSSEVTATIHELEQKGIRFLTDRSEEFPKKLLDIPDRPYALFIKGCIHSDGTEKRVAVIGARVCSAYGRYAAGKFAGELAEYGIATVSGMARGVDSAAHQGTVDAGGRTYAILGCGVDICYPPENKYLYDRIIEQGAVLSEYPPGTRPNAWQFPERNRLISGMADCVVITEARQKSGSLITVKHALEQGVDVCAVPGRINDVLSGGCNRLIQEGAFPATSTLDILFSMGINMKKNEKTNYSNCISIYIIYNCIMRKI